MESYKLHSSSIIGIISTDVMTVEDSRIIGREARYTAMQLVPYVTMVQRPVTDGG